MKTYLGEPTTPLKVTVRSSAKKSAPLRLLPGREQIAWGESTVPAANLALAILNDVLKDQPERALRLMQRAKWRLVKDWAAGAPWSITEEEIIAVIADIEKTERETATGRRMMANERGIIPNVAAPLGDIGWKDGNEPTLTPNLERKP